MPIKKTTGVPGVKSVTLGDVKTVDLQSGIRSAEPLASTDQTKTIDDNVKKRDDAAKETDKTWKQADKAAKKMDRVVL